ncbi:MAG: hypothetical protein ACJZ12_05330 [Candidatus Neomarinimicrobiota bacterium]
MEILKNPKNIISGLLISISLGSTTTTVKTFHILESFGKETQELKNSITINFNLIGLMVDSTIYNHNVPLSKKYVYVSGLNEGLKLKRDYDKEMVLSYKFQYDNEGNRISTTLYGYNDSLYWKQYQKFDNNNKIVKRIRYNPMQAINPNMMYGENDSKNVLWGENYDYDSTRTRLERKEIYNGYVLVITNYDIDSSGAPIKSKEYFDPSVIFQTIFFHDENGKVKQEKSVGRLGQSLESKTYEYDILKRRVSTTIYNKQGEVENIYNTVFDDDNFKTYDYYSDSEIKLYSIKETLLDNQGRTYIEAVLDGQRKILEKKVYYYNENGRIREIKQYDMLRRGRKGKNEIPIRVSTYEYD